MKGSLKVKIIEPSVELINAPEYKTLLTTIEAAGRTCYKSEDKITDGSAEKFVRGIIKRGHEAVIEHGSLTVRFICDRGVSHEIVRHRLAAFCQESTRYCNYGMPDGTDKPAVLTSLIAALRETLPKTTALSVSIEKNAPENSGLTPAVLALFDRIYADSETVDLAALTATLPADFNAETRLVQLTQTPPATGSYVIVSD